MCVQRRPLSDKQQTQAHASPIWFKGGGFLGLRETEIILARAGNRECTRADAGAAWAAPWPDFNRPSRRARVQSSFRPCGNRRQSPANEAQRRQGHYFRLEIEDPPWIEAAAKKIGEAEEVAEGASSAVDPRLWPDRFYDIYQNITNQLREQRHRHVWCPCAKDNRDWRSANSQTGPRRCGRL